MTRFTYMHGVHLSEMDHMQPRKPKRRGNTNFVLYKRKNRNLLYSRSWSVGFVEFVAMIAKTTSDQEEDEMW